MIKVTKNIKDVPDSLAYPTVNGLSETTHSRREEVIIAEKYINSDTFNERYKQGDTRKKLIGIYKGKCCYCEQKSEAYHVEHYRPKGEYWWLAYSWDNLLYICPYCNTNKGKHFEILGTKAAYKIEDLSRIHELRDEYNELESPSMLNPECDNLENMWTFERNGNIKSSDSRGAYTIEKIKIDRKDLCDLRYNIIRDFESLALDYWVVNANNEEELRKSLEVLVYDFVKKSEDEREPFLAFRRYAIHTFINDIILEIYT